MAGQRQSENPAGYVTSVHPSGFLVTCILAFIVSVAATAYFCRSMCCEMAMPGGWTMSMMWMPMPDQTWFGSAASFLLMWLAMMVAMMLPSALPAFLNTGRAAASLSVTVAGYFTVWLAVGAGIYFPGVLFAAAAMHWESFSRVVPMLSGAALIAAGTFQFTRWKSAALLRCRSLGCNTSSPERESSFRLGCKQGAACCLCCTGPMMILTALGMMNPFLIIGVAIVIAAEKLLPRPEIVARLVGVATIVAGVLMAIRPSQG